MVDSSIVCVCFVSCLLLSSVAFLFFRKFYPVLLNLSVITMASVFFINLIDIFYFAQFGTRLNQFATEVPSNFSTVISMIYHEFPVIRALLAFAVIVFVFVYITKKIFKIPRAAETVPFSFSLKWSFITIISFAALSFLYYDGPFWKLTSFSGSGFINQLSSNGVYSFVESLKQQRLYKQTLSIFPEIPDADAIDFVRKISIHKNEIPIEGRFPTLRKSIQSSVHQKKNIVIILCESFSALKIGALGGGNLSPQFDKWSKRGILFTHCFSNGPRTHFGLTSVVAGFPAVIGSHLIRRKGVNEFQTLGNILHEAGYKTNFFYCGDADFDDMKMFMEQGGFQNIYDQSKMKNIRFSNSMGVCDEDMFDNACNEIFDGDTTPELSVLLTVSNHAPHHAPDYFLKEHPEAIKMTDEESTFYYADYALGKFLDKCSAQPEFSNTLFLILADHGDAYKPGDWDYNVYRIPALLLNSSHGSGTFDSTCSQMDFASTLINECGFTGAYHFIGQNLFDKDFLPFSISRNTESAILFSRGNHIYITDFQYGGERFYLIDSLHNISESFIPSDYERSETISFVKKYVEGLSAIYRNGLYQCKNLTLK